MPNIAVPATDVALVTYKSYVAILTQVGTDAPTAVVQNSADSNYIGAIVWSRESDGYFIGTLTGAFVINKTICLVNGEDSIGNVRIMNAGYHTVNSVYVSSQDNTSTNVDGLFQASIEVRVYLT